jgi:hypothetical protein
MLPIIQQHREKHMRDDSFRPPHWGFERIIPKKDRSIGPIRRVDSATSARLASQDYAKALVVGSLPDYAQASAFGAGTGLSLVGRSLRPPDDLARCAGTIGLSSTTNSANSDLRHQSAARRVVKLAFVLLQPDAGASRHSAAGRRPRSD